MIIPVVAFFLGTGVAAFVLDHAREPVSVSSVLLALTFGIALAALVRP